MFTSNLFACKLAFELVRIYIKFVDHVINVFYMILQILLRFFDPLVPKHG